MTLAHVSEKPWSEYTASDYTPEQWHRACLIHQHSGAPTSKNECKLPVRTPNGAVNRNGVHAAAAALAGARGGVQASAEEKASARKALIRLYGELGEEAPPSLLAHSGLDAIVHYGIRGMRWGIRRSRQEIDTSPDAPEHTRARTLQTVAQKSGTRKLTNKDLEDLNKRLNLEKNYKQLVSNEKDKASINKAAGWFGSKILKVGDMAVDEVAKAHVRMALTQKGFIPKK